jgi:uncharacterized protein (TIGR02145 family)
MAYFRDTRNKQIYKVKKMIDGKCWMVDNLKYIDTPITNTADNTTGMTYNQGDHRGNGVTGGTGAYNTVDESSTQNDDNSDKAFYNNPMASANCYNHTSIPSGTLTHCGYLYNWYAATGGTGTYDQDAPGNQVSGSICPANFRLPTATSTTTGAGNGTSFNYADFAVLNASMNANNGAGAFTTPGVTNSSYYDGWQPTGAWGGSFSGYWLTGPSNQGSNGYYWSSTVYLSTYARNLYFYDGYVGPGNDYGDKFYGFAVRCVLP